MTWKRFTINRRTFAVGALTTTAGMSRALAQGVTAGSPLGPFYPHHHSGETDADLTRIAGHERTAIGEVIEVSGRVLDHFGNPVSDARIDIWQANAAGRYAHPDDNSDSPLDPGFQGFARLETGADGTWAITTIKPGFYGSRTRHIHMDVQADSKRSTLQMYFPEDAEANSRDVLYSSLGEMAATSLATALGGNRYSWDIVLE